MDAIILALILTFIIATTMLVTERLETMSAKTYRGYVLTVCNNGRDMWVEIHFHGEFIEATNTINEAEKQIDQWLSAP